MRRLPDWLPRMNAVIAEHQESGFEWGRTDCANFVMDAVSAMRGEPDPFADDRRRYKSKGGAGKMIRRYRASCVDEILAREFPEIAPAMAGVGDIATIALPEGGTACGIFVGHEILMRSQTGLCRLPRSRALKAFKVQ